MPAAQHGTAAVGEFKIDDAWLVRQVETIIEPDLPIIDPHHHLWERDRGTRHLFDELLRAVDGGRNIRATVYSQCFVPMPIRSPLGETEFTNGIAAMSASGLYGAA